MVQSGNDYHFVSEKDLSPDAWLSYFIHVSAHCDIIKNLAQYYPIKKKQKQTLTLIIPILLKTLLFFALLTTM